MKLHLVFIGNKFIYNTPLHNYILRNVEQKSVKIDTITYFKESDNSLFLFLEEQLNSDTQLLFITTNKNFSTIGKLICTVTSDNQVLHEDILLPQKASVFEKDSYLLEYKKAILNVVKIEESQNMPPILLHINSIQETIHLFEEEEGTLKNILDPIAQTYEVEFHISKIVEGWLQIDVVSKKYGEISNFIQSAKKLLPKNMIASSNIIVHIIEKLTLQTKKISFAESCSGGLLSYYFTKENGTSNILDGSLITYSNDLKENWLAVSHETIETYGAVSQAVVREMSEGVISVSSADYALSISGIAGIGGGTKEKPVGTVCIGVRSKTKHIEEHLQFFGDRNYIQEQSALYAVKMLLLIDKETFF